MSVDVERGMVFLPVGSPTYDFFGGDRKGQNLFGNSLVALAARTGRRIWHFQMVHHDIWDYDIPAQPVLATIRRRNRSQDVVVQVTKMGLVFVLDRGDGTPVFPVAERAVPSAGVPGESPWPTQPFPTLPQPLVRHAITRADLSDVTPESAKFCRALFDSVHGGRIYTPMGTEHTLVVPGNLGGANWSGAAFDSRSRRLFVNVNELPLVAALESDQGAMPTISHYRRFVDEQGRPCVKPPWGLLVAIDLDSGSVAWRSPLGNDESVRASRPTGLPSLGGAIATAGGLVFIAGTTDRRIRAFDASDGRELWSAALDASGAGCQRARNPGHIFQRPQPAAIRRDCRRRRRISQSRSGVRYACRIRTARVTLSVATRVNQKISLNPTCTKRWKPDCPVVLRLMRPKSAESSSVLY
jgi:quinoprotein glucose dehydrogenase